jgi:hypothetical protein
MLTSKHFQTIYIFKSVMLFLHPDATFSTTTYFMLWKTTVTKTKLIFLQGAGLGHGKRI